MTTAHDARAQKIHSLREVMHRTPRRRSEWKDDPTRTQFELGIVLMASGRDATDDFVEGFELLRAAHEGNNTNATAYLRFMADVTPDAFDVVSEIGDERRRLLRSLASPTAHEHGREQEHEREDERERQHTPRAPRVGSTSR